MTPTVLAFIATWLVLIAGGCLVYVTVRQYGQVLLDREVLEQRLSHAERSIDELAVQVAALARAGHVHETLQPPAGLPLGSQAPGFSLADLDGQPHSLSEYLSLPRLVVFFSTTCSFCQQLAPRLGQLGAAGRRVLLIGSGGSEQYRVIANEHGWQCDVVLDQTGETLRAYEATGTPTGYLVDVQGRIASDLAVGSEALLRLVPGGAACSPGEDLTEDALRTKEQAATDRVRAAGLAVRESRLNRNGLPPGMPAPEFELPDLSGRAHTLAEFRGKRTLLVFSDPDCGPCQAMAPQLRALYEQHRVQNLNVVLIGRGDPEANRAKTVEHGFEFPVLLQQHWELSREYAMFATPIGYLIDEQGLIAKEVAVGADAILQLI
jgi:peroxiredoxin